MPKLLVAISFVLYLVAPKEYSLAFCIGCSGLYLYIAVLSLKQEIKDGVYFSFNLLFWISLFCTTFIVPLFVLPIGGESLYYQYANKGSALVLLASSVYYSGWYKQYVQLRPKAVSRDVCIYAPAKTARVLSIFSVIITIVYIFQLSSFLGASSIYENDIGLGFTYSLIQSILCTSLIVSVISNANTKQNKLGNFLKNNSVVLICYAIIIITSILIGDRTLPIYLSLCVLASYILYVKNIPLITQWVLILCAAALMVTIGKTRNSDLNFRENGISSIASTTYSTISGSEEFVDLFSDFLPATSALYLCENWRDVNGGKLFYPLKILKLPFTPIPYAPTIISRVFFGVDNTEMSSAVLTTNLYSDKVRVIYGGLGTHGVADIYVSWGIVGVFIFFYLFGLIIGKSQKLNRDNIYWAVVYIALLCNALYIPRASILDNFRAIVYELFFLWLATRFSGLQFINNYEQNKDAKH